MTVPIAETGFGWHRKSTRPTPADAARYHDLVIALDRQSDSDSSSQPAETADNVESTVLGVARFEQLSDMTMTGLDETVADLIERTAIDGDGDKIGRISKVYSDSESGEPEWLAVNTGLFGSKVSFVPIAGATLVDGDVMVGYPKSQVKDAPRADLDSELSVEEENALYDHYGRSEAPVHTISLHLETDFDAIALAEQRRKERIKIDERDDDR